MRVGIIELLVDQPINGPLGNIYTNYFRKQFFGIGPQAVSVWCRQLGHQVHYTTYYGQQDPKSLLPNDLDVVFISAFTHISGLAYSLAKLFRREKTLTVIGGPHARCFPRDCLRFFDLVVKDCDKSLIDDILCGRYDTPAIVDSGRPLREFPSVEERRPEIEIAAFVRGQPTKTSIIPLLTSSGCPFTCNFCSDWNNDYLPLAQDHLKTDLEHISENWPEAIIAYHDPNFGVRFDEAMDTIESIPKERRNPYIMESSLSILKESRLHRLRTTNCYYVAPGIESWADYSNKAGVGQKQGRAKFDQIVDHFLRLKEYIPGQQGNILLGSDVDKGTEPIELTKDFIRRLPNVWVSINIPTPLGGTPLYDQYMAEKRILKTMPFPNYFNYMSSVVKHYDPVQFYDNYIGILKVVISKRMIAKRIFSKAPSLLRFIHNLRTVSTRQELADAREVRSMLAGDKKFLAFHEGRSEVLPEFYFHKAEQRLGSYGGLLSRAELIPELNGATPPREVAPSQPAAFHLQIGTSPAPVMETAE